MSTLKMSKELAKNEIHKTMKLCNFCTRKVGISFIDERPKTIFSMIWIYLWFVATVLVVLLKLFGQINYAIMKLVSSAPITEFVANLHIIGYDTMSFGKLLTIWYKRNIFRKLVCELEDLWPTDLQDNETAEIKKEKLSGLRIGQFCMNIIITDLTIRWLNCTCKSWYAFWNILGVWLYNVTPIVIYVYRKIQGMSAHLGYIWHISYPYDQTQPLYHEFSFAFEVYGGVVSVWSMLGSDILFMTMASHISMLLRLLQIKIRQLGINKNQEDNDCYKNIISAIKIHQRLITYGTNLENAFSVVNLINVLLSSVNICFVVFNILLDPWMALSNKFFLGAALTQVGILCWYADDISKSSTGVSNAVYESGWYTLNIRCQRTLLLLIQRSQKPLYFTAFKFRPITMSTYSSILTSSYSYFTLLYTMYGSD